MTAFHQLHPGHPFVVRGFSGAPIFACNANGVPTGPVIGINVGVNRRAKGTAYLLSAGVFARMHQQIHALAFKKETA